MNIEELLNCEDVEVLDKLTLADLDNIFRPYFTVTRPELAKEQVKKPTTKLDQLDRMLKAAENAKKLGVDIVDLFKGLK